jgi:hypothetical protein
MAHRLLAPSVDRLDDHAEPVGLGQNVDQRPDLADIAKLQRLLDGGGARSDVSRVVLVTLAAGERGG